MSYIVLARKYRPQGLDSLIGQPDITRQLSEAIKSGRLGHAFIFCGPRGTGKTSCARILAKSLNCEKGPTINPCGECFACQEIAQGRSLDVIEIDAASNRGIDEIRLLRENVKFAPGYARYKVYIIDEVHMLTSEAFNALLKTLEEPPAHVKFILATTEIHKVPATILSRCQRFDFRRISLELVTEHLKDICQKEQLSIDDEALFAVAKASGGSMRDALSILDQLGGATSREIKVGDVSGMLGVVEVSLVFDLAQVLLEKQMVNVLQLLQQMIDQGKDLRQLGRDLVEHFRHLMVVKVGGSQLNELIDYPKHLKERLDAQAKLTELAHILKAIDFLIEAQEESRVVENWRLPLEVAFAKITLLSVHSAVKTAPVSAAATMPTSAVTPIPKKEVPLKSKPLRESQGPLTIQDVLKHWSGLTHALAQEKMSLGNYMQEGKPIDLINGKLVIAFSQDNVFFKESLEAKDHLLIIEKVFSQKLNAPVTIGLKLIQNLTKDGDEPIVERAIETFGGQVIKEWHND